MSQSCSHLTAWTWDVGPSGLRTRAKTAGVPGSGACRLSDWLIGSPGLQPATCRSWDLSASTDASSSPGVSSWVYVLMLPWGLWLVRSLPCPSCDRQRKHHICFWEDRKPACFGSWVWEGSAVPSLPMSRTQSLICRTGDRGAHQRGREGYLEGGRQSPARVGCPDSTKAAGVS